MYEILERLYFRSRHEEKMDRKKRIEQTMEIDRVEKGRLTALQCRKDCIMLSVCNFQHSLSDASFL
jgi:hypothetical protein